MVLQTTAHRSERAAASDLTAELARRASETRFEDLPPEVVELARQCLLDWLGVTLAGSGEPLAAILADEVRDQGGKPQATLIGFGEKVNVAQAALVNGAASHALDYDDVNQAITGHPTAAIVPGLLALAEARRASGAEFIAAFTAGYEMACRVGRLVNPGHYERGFHATATLGCFGSAAACARLLGLDREATARALGIAATQAAGLKAMFGTMCKPLHAGKAAANGLFAARLAARGFQSPTDALECRQGFAAAMSDDFNPEAALEEPPGGFHMRANLFKYHAACYLTHAAIECAIGLRRQHDLRPESIANITVRVDEGCDSVCNIASPRTGLEAKFSLRLTTAFALGGVDTTSIESYNEANCARPELVALRDKTRVELVAGWPRTLTEVIVLTEEGARLEARHDSGVPAEDLMEQRARLERKFLALAEPRLGSAVAERLVTLCRDLDRLGDLGEPIGLCASKPGPRS